jgi:hypothetical protein
MILSDKPRLRKMDSLPVVIRKILVQLTENRLQYSVMPPRMMSPKIEGRLHPFVIDNSVRTGQVSHKDI